MALFRSEALARRGGRLEGEVILAVPRSWQLLAGLLLAAVAAGALLLLLGRTAEELTIEVTAVAPGRLDGIVPAASAAAIAPGACGALQLGEAQRDGGIARACLIAYRSPPQIVRRADGRTERGRLAQFGTLEPVAPGVALRLRLAIGEQRLIEALW